MYGGFAWPGHETELVGRPTPVTASFALMPLLSVVFAVVSIESGVSYADAARPGCPHPRQRRRSLDCAGGPVRSNTAALAEPHSRVGRDLLM